MADFIKDLIFRYPMLESQLENFSKAADCLETAVRNGNKILVCGNGGSAADAEHIVGELMKGFLLPRKLPENLQKKLKNAGCSPELCQELQLGIPAISLVSGVALPTAFANDINAVDIFAQQVLNLGKKGDILLSISTSGNSGNVLYAMQIARALEMLNIGLTGARKCQMEKWADILLKAPENSTPKIQEYHLPIYHALCAELEARLYGN